ncbi:SRPBCC family protein [uncultured Jatrophihabitans sp.]|uniref:aromatic ring-hydroxylating oxygenase subunit alpha n=1 Tax=uncultured Jatrophihabitans sp. TaxID=1610747 RepID=UPI0035CB2B11
MTVVDHHKTSFALLEGEYYTSEDIFAKEFDRIFSRDWVYACHISQLPSKGSFVKIEHGGEEIVVVRGAGDALYANLNVCRHRGFRICEADAGKVRAFVCPYHQWRYDLDGKLSGVPQMKDGEYFDYADFPLATALVEVWQGMVFVNLDPEPTDSLADRLKAFEATVENFAPTKTRLAHETRFEVAANWKVAAENSLECYHCVGTHPTLCKVVDIDGLQADLRQWLVEDDADGAADGSVDQGMGGMRIQAGLETLSADGSLITDKLLGDHGADDIGRGVSGGVTVVPNLFYAAYYIDHWWTLAFRPLSAKRTVIQYQWFVREDAVEGVDYDVAKLIEVGHVTQSEDNVLIERTQSGMDSRYFTPGPIGSDVERALHDFVSNYRTFMD